MDLFSKIEETAFYVKQKVKTKPRVGIVLGSGLGGLVEIVEGKATIAYSSIPNFPVSTVKGHSGELVFGKIGDTDVVLMAGRFHYYEGYNMQEVTFPIRVMKALGVEILILSNAAGGTNPEFAVGDLMIIKDHINLVPEHPLRGPNDERLGPRFPDMSEAYDHALIAIAEKIAAENNITVRTGVYVGLQGPSFETPAEYRFLNRIGGDAVGMSTVPEVIVARHGGMRVFAISVICNIGFREIAATTTHEEVLDAAAVAAPKMATLVTGLAKQQR
ncbi:MAG: purine nucleoside phosphorylase [Flavipsychrobacter sp.]|jgi:purine-nucleoside phosphorylase|nr:purine nucleoside phosphorylase [Flavipsychrobacter sp.]